MVFLPLQINRGKKFTFLLRFSNHLFKLPIPKIEILKFLNVKFVKNYPEQACIFQFIKTTKVSIKLLNWKRAHSTSIYLPRDNKFTNTRYAPGTPAGNSRNQDKLVYT